MKNAVVGQSGGPTSVINSSLYGVVNAALDNPSVGNIYGMIHGIEGFLKDEIYDFTDLPGEGLTKLKYTPGAFLGSCRYKLPEDLKDPVYVNIFEKLQKLDIGYFCYIGGNDSMDTVSKLSRYGESIGSDISFMGIPKTIDNDLPLTDHTPGFGSAARFIAQTVREISYDASVYENRSVTIVEIMGRHAGWLTGAAALAREFPEDNPRLIYLPEVSFDPEIFTDQCRKTLETTPNLVVAVSEGVHDADGKFICEYSGEAGTDNFGHKMLTGCGKYLEGIVKAKLGVKVRSVELNVPQRCSAAMLSARDRDEAVMSGEYGMNAAVSGSTGKMVVFKRTGSSEAYHIECGLEDVDLICNKEKTVPVEWIINEGSDVSADFTDYAAPCIKGNVEIPLGSDGLWDFIKR